MKKSYVVIENTNYKENMKIVIVILKMKLMMLSTYLIFMTKQIQQHYLTKHQIIYVMTLRKQHM